ncbi:MULTISPECIES: IS110 family transposase [Bacillaceae]|uniref:IS110 family transposase n=1 Tax=Niallia hominis TaxID=3133173 RepID=A0ABV1F5M7_9BACI|nr:MULTISPECIES: IS110 family transposase [Bacillaceae]MCF2650296.1 IS110 family transposase [Niallia circulans]CAI9394798.1 IS110 family transposase ISAzo28 [Bacillus sp. T2.9-1]
MQVVVERACGLDVHKNSITACVVTPEGKEIKTFSTMTVFLLELVDWVKEHGCTQVAMESTGVYWKPIVNLLELEEIGYLVVNAQHIKAVPGRKTDVKDAEWICELLRHGLLKGSYIPNRDQRELRELVRYRRSMVEERARQHNRIQKVLEGANIKLGSVVSDIFGVSSREMLQSIADGEDNVEILANSARGKLKEKRQELELSLQGRITAHQRMMLKSILSHIDFLTKHIEMIDEEIESRLEPSKEDIERLDSIPGIAIPTAQQILAEIGNKVGEQFPTAAHLCSWAGVVPGHNESAGKKKSSKTKKGNKYLRSALIEAAHSVARSKTYLGALYRRICARKGRKRAGMAVAHAMLRIAYYLLTRKEYYVDLGEDHFDKQKQQSIVSYSVKRLEKLGYQVIISKVS